MEKIYHGQIVSFVQRVDWLSDPSLTPILAQQYLTYRFLPQMSIQDQIHYGTLQIREVPDQWAKESLVLQVKALTNPQMAAMLLGNLGVQPQTMAGKINEIAIQGNNCIYRTIDGLAAFTYQPVRSYIGVIDLGFAGVEIIAIALTSVWPLLLPQILDIFASITPHNTNPGTHKVQGAPIYINQSPEGNISYKVRQQDGHLKTFDELASQDHASITININNNTLVMGQDTEINGQINFGNNSIQESFKMNGDHNINISDNAKVNNLVQDGTQNITNIQQGGYDPKELTALIENLLTAIKNTNASDADTELGTLELKKARIQAEKEEKPEKIGQSLENAAEYLKKSETVVKSGINIGELLLKAGKIVGTIISWF